MVFRHGAAPGELETLASRMGIVPEFRSARGDMRRACADTQRRLIEAMGVRAGDEAQAKESNRALDRESWSRALPPVKVLRKGFDPIGVDIVLASDVEDLRWQLTLEDGTERSAHVAFKGLEKIAASSIGGRAFEKRRLRLEADLPIGSGASRVKISA